MTINEAIEKVDALKPNSYTQSEKIEWLSIVDGLIKRTIVDKHEGGEDIIFNGYTDDTPLDTELIAQYPYDDMYIPWLESKIDYNNAEYTKYNNSITRFNDTFSAYSSDYNRTHMPKGKAGKYF